VKGPGALALGLLGLLVLTACATANPSPPPPSGQRVRCLSDPRETDMRPLFFFFCVESP
jgi:hypothetical protein